MKQIPIHSFHIMNSYRTITNYFPIILAAACAILFPAGVSAECVPEDGGDEGRDKSLALKYKVAAIASILAASAIGVCLPWLGRRLRPGGDIFVVVKAFAGGAILSTGCVHVLPDAFDSLSSVCLPEHPWRAFPFAGFVAMVSSIATLMADACAMAYFRRRAPPPPTTSEEGDDEETLALAAAGRTETLRHRVITQVLELGIIVHSVIIGIALGASQSPKTIRPLIAALSFHQLFEGIGLGGSIAQARFRGRAMALMVVFFAITTPTGIAIGIGISNAYKEDSPTTLIVQGLLNSASAGILIYMALVDLLAADFMGPALQRGGWLFLGASVAVLAGAGCMSVIAVWA